MCTRAVHASKGGGGSRGAWKAHNWRALLVNVDVNGMRGRANAYGSGLLVSEWMRALEGRDCPPRGGGKRSRGSEKSRAGGPELVEKHAGVFCFSRGMFVARQQSAGERSPDAFGMAPCAYLLALLSWLRASPLGRGSFSWSSAQMHPACCSSQRRMRREAVTCPLPGHGHHVTCGTKSAHALHSNMYSKCLKNEL